MEGASTIPGHALAHHYQQKWQKYGDACDREIISFLPVEVLGGFHEATVGLVKRLGESLARAGGQDERDVIRHLFQRLSVLLIWGSSSLIVSQIQSHTNPSIDGIN